MKTLKIIYYRRKVKEAVAYAKYWGDKAIASLPNMEKWTACIDHMMYWLCKSIEYAVSANKELESLLGLLLFLSRNLHLL